jgi:hypothetical protein
MPQFGPLHEMHPGCFSQTSEVGLAIQTVLVEIIVAAEHKSPVRRDEAAEILEGPQPVSLWMIGNVTCNNHCIEALPMQWTKAVFLKRIAPLTGISCRCGDDLIRLAGGISAISQSDNIAPFDQPVQETRAGSIFKPCRRSRTVRDIFSF